MNDTGESPACPVFKEGRTFGAQHNSFTIALPRHAFAEPLHSPLC